MTSLPWNHSINRPDWCDIQNKPHMHCSLCSACANLNSVRSTCNSQQSQEEELILHHSTDTRMRCLSKDGKSQNYPFIKWSAQLYFCETACKWCRILRVNNLLPLGIKSPDICRQMVWTQNNINSKGYRNDEQRYPIFRKHAQRFPQPNTNNRFQ